MAPIPEVLPAPDMRATADMRAVVAAYVALQPPPIAKSTPMVARQSPSFRDGLVGVLSKQSKPVVEPVGDVVHRVIPGPGGQLLLRVYRPTGSGPFPVLVYFHGGGWVIADLNTYDASCRALTNMANAVVVSVAYRQAPEHKFPAAVEDAFAAYRWVLDNASLIHGDASRVAVGGESAGGNLATVTAIMARDRGVKMPVHQLLVYPVMNAAFNTPSYNENTTTLFLNKAAMEWFYSYYLPSPIDGKDPKASPLREPNLKGLPETTIINADLDPLRDEGGEYAKRLHAAGVPVKRTLYTGVAHEFFGMGAAVAKAKQAEMEPGQRLKMSFGRG